VPEAAARSTGRRSAQPVGL